MTINFRFSDKAHSSAGGLSFFQKLLEESQLGGIVAEALPKGKIRTPVSPIQKFQNLILGLIQGADCLDDMSQCHRDPVFAHLAGEALSPMSYGNFLRSFRKPMISSLQKALATHAFELHKRLNPSGSLILDIDSTSHLQYGKKMEGLQINYSGENCLDSLQVFDQFGLAYHLDVREGATFTAQNAPYVIEEIGRVVRSDIQRPRFLRADSGYCNNQVFDACDKQNFGFVIALRENFSGALFRNRLSWQKARDEALSKEGIELSQNLYHSKSNGKLYRVVLMRKSLPGPRTLFEEDRWETHAFITNISESEMDAEQVLLFYRGRGNAENFIRELKYGFDLKHFPCQKLDANRVYGLIAAFAHNLVRFVSNRMYPGKTAFVKKIRFRLVSLAAQVVRQARQTFIVFHRRHKEEVERCLMNIKLSPGFG